MRNRKLRPWVKTVIYLLIFAILTYVMWKYAKSAPCDPTCLR